MTIVPTSKLKHGQRETTKNDAEMNMNWQTSLKWTMLHYTCILTSFVSVEVAWNTCVELSQQYFGYILVVRLNIWETIVVTNVQT